LKKKMFFLYKISPDPSLPKRGTRGDIAKEGIKMELLQKRGNGRTVALKEGGKQTIGGVAS